MSAFGIDVSKDRLDWADGFEGSTGQSSSDPAGIEALVRRVRRRVRRFGEGLGLLAKTDPIDARLLARFGTLAAPALTPGRRGMHRTLTDLVGRRRQLMAMLTAEKNRLGIAPKALRREIAGLISILQRRIDQLDRQVDAAIAEDAERSQVRRSSRARRLSGRRYPGPCSSTCPSSAR